MSAEGVQVKINFDSQVVGRDVSAFCSKIKGCILGNNTLTEMNDKVSILSPNQLLKNRVLLADLLDSNCRKFDEHFYVYMTTLLKNKPENKKAAMTKSIVEKDAAILAMTKETANLKNDVLILRERDSANQRI